MFALVYTSLKESRKGHGGVATIKGRDKQILRSHAVAIPHVEDPRGTFSACCVPIGYICGVRSTRHAR